MFYDSDIPGLRINFLHIMILMDNLPILNVGISPCAQMKRNL
jgi:hypothetical protein